MATTFYLSSTATSGVTPGFAAWDRTTESDRYIMSPSKDASALANKTIWANGSVLASTTALARQYVSNPMLGGIAFVTTDTVTGVVRCMESGTNDNINRQPTCIKVYSLDGTSLQATLLPLLHYGPNTTEWISGTLTSKQLFVSTGKALVAAYTTAVGDRLVIEIGGQCGAAGTTVTGTQNFGTAGAANLDNTEVDTGADNPWFAISRNVTFGYANSATVKTGSKVLSSKIRLVINSAIILAASKVSRLTVMSFVRRITMLVGCMSILLMALSCVSGPA